jgi:AcrR family transcriptional regulator
MNEKVKRVGTKERKEREREKQRELILEAAGEIFMQEGLEKLSIRKIADKIEYSPAIIYHYFQDKEDIVNHLMASGYRKIMSSLSTVQASADPPEIKLKELMRNYINAALEMPDEYMAVQLNKSPAIQEYTATLFKGASVEKPALTILCQCLKDIYPNSDAEDDTIELTAQVIAASSLGLIVKLILEKDIGEEQRKKLIDHFINWMMRGTVIVR